MQERQDPRPEGIDDTPNPSAAPATTTPAPRKRRRWLRAVVIAFLLLVLTAAIVLTLAWRWAGQADSLASTLNRVAGWMPAEQKLEATGVQGSLRHGGRIEWLRWSSPALQVEVKDADIQWRLQPLLQRALHLGKVDMQELRIQSSPQPKDDTPTEPLQSLVLPIDIDLPFNIRNLIWEGPPAAEIHDLEGHYRFTKGEHQLEVRSLNYADGSYTAQATLQGAAPMQLKAEATARVKAPLPQQPDQWLQVAANAHVSGTLAGADARLDVQANARTLDTEGSEAAQRPLTADVQATVRPWLAQPIEQAKANLQHVDLGLLLPSLPRTDLNGNVQAGPQAGADGAQGWALLADITNALPGAWDKARLPVRALRAQAEFDGQQLWTLKDAKIDLSQARDGSLQAQGTWRADTGAIDGQAQLQAVNPASLYSSLDAAPLSGTLSASTDAQQHVQFALDVRAPEGGRSNAALRIDSARAQGTWAAPVLQLQALHLQALQATVNAPQLRFDTDTQQLQTQATVQVPGAQLQLGGDIGPQDGQGQLQLQLQAAEALAQWLQRLPGVKDPLGGAQLQGSGDVDLQWRGGWQALQQRLANPAAPVQASNLRITATAKVPQLRYAPSQGSASTLRDVQLQAQGTPQALDINLQAHAQVAEQLLQLRTQLQAGLSTQRGAHALDWQANIQNLSAQWQADAASAPWKADLAEAVQVQQRHAGGTVRTARIEAGASSLRITPPAAFVPEATPTRPGESAVPIGTAAVQWQPLLLQQTASGQWGVRSQGTLQHIPLGWINAFSPDPEKPLLSSAGLGGNLVVQGNWDIDTTARQPRANIVVERSSGDLRLAVEDTEAAPITVIRSSGATSADGNAQTRRVLMGGRGMAARVQQLRVQAQLQGQALQAQVLWKSERAGELEADIRTQLLQSKDGAWQLPEQAPLGGRIQARLPNIGVWAMFAPPGWRVAGSLDADVQLGGTRSAPQWNGTLGADGLSIVSMVDGVDLNDGRLRAQLQGTQLRINELFLRGGGTSQARVLGMSGNLTPPPTDSGTLTGSGTVSYDPQAPNTQSGIRLDLQFQAAQLQVLSRADRQLSVSGNVRAGMNEGQVALRGDLRIDRAAIVLADVSAPTLDSDVYVHTAASRQAEAEALARAQAQSPEDAGRVQAAKPVDIDINLDLGRDFALQGYGITTRLEGQLQVLSGPRLLGEIRTVQGRYRAWGQSLDVQNGTIRFNGPLDNPSLEIYAIRPNIEVQAGVKITGSASAPRVGLFSEPTMSDAEILSWVVMGRDPAAGGAETALLQQAAMALLSGGGSTGNIAGQLGLDEIGFKGAAEGSEAESAAITVGKRLTKDLYVAYEQSLSGAMGTLLIFYDLSRSLTLRAQTGVQSAIDLIYTRKKD